MKDENLYVILNVDLVVQKTANSTIIIVKDHNHASHKILYSDKHDSRNQFLSYNYQCVRHVYSKFRPKEGRM